MAPPIYRPQIRYRGRGAGYGHTVVRGERQHAIVKIGPEQYNRVYNGCTTTGLPIGEYCTKLAPRRAKNEAVEQ